MAAEHLHIWTDETCNIRKVVERQQLPIMVRVTEGIYGDTEAETFSQGDLLMLHKVLTLSKVVACFVDGEPSGFRKIVKEDNYGYLEKEEILIPLGYHGKLKIFCPDAGHRVFDSVQQLIKDLPRFVKLIEPIKTTDGKTIHRNDIIELDRHLPTQGLVCKWDGKMVCISEDTKGQYLLMPDSTEYTLKEVINRFPFPQFVTFHDDEFPMLVTKNLEEAVDNLTSFEGEALKLIGLRTQETIVGHHKAAESVLYETSSQEKEHCKRSVVLIPMDSEAANDIDVNIPAVDDDDDDYELMQAMNFSRTSVDDESFDGNLYLDFVKRPKIYMYEEPPSKRRPPPPLPETTKHKPPPPIHGSAQHKPPPPLPGKAQDKRPPPPPLPERTGTAKSPPLPERTGTAKNPPVPGLDNCTQVQDDLDVPYENQQNTIVNKSENQEIVQDSTSPDMERLHARPRSAKTSPVPDRKTNFSLPPPLPGRKPSSSSPRNRNQSSSSDLDSPPLTPGPRKSAGVVAKSPIVDDEDGIYEITDKKPYVNMEPPRSPMPWIATDKKPYVNMEPPKPECNVTDDEKRGIASTEAYISKVPQKFRLNIKRVHSQLVDFVKRKTFKNRESKPSVSDYKEEFVLSDDHYAKPKEPESDDNYDYPDLSKMKRETLKRQSDGYMQQRSDHQKHFESLKSAELTQLLNECRMDGLGKICKKEGLDGSFFMNISDKELEETFSLGKIQLTKFKKIRDEGWKPSI